MTFSLSCNGTTINAEVITNSFQKTEILYSKLKQADNSARFQCIFTIALANFLKQYINNDIEVQIKDGAEDVFFGYVRKTIRFTKTQINQPVAIEVVSPSYFLDKEIPNTTAYMNKSLSFTLNALLTAAGVQAVRDLSDLSYSPKIIKVASGETYKSVITEILYEYGYVWDFDNSGYFYITPLFNQPVTSSITDTFNGSNCLDQITITAKENDYDCVRGTYNRVEELQDGLIFTDTTGADQVGAGTCLQPVNARSYFAGEEFNYLDTDSDKGDVVWIESLRNDVAVDSSKITWSASLSELDSSKTAYGQRLGTQICFKAYNSDSSSKHNFTKLNFYGHVFIANAETEVQSFGDKKANEITLKYICEKAKAEEFVQRVTNWYRFANNEIALNSRTNFQLGDYVVVTDYGIGTYYGRVIKKTYKLNTDRIDYVIETIEGYTPATVEDRNTPDIGGIRQSSFDAVLNKSKTYTDDQITHATMQASPIYEAIFEETVIKKDTQGNYTPSSIKASGRSITGDSESTSYSGMWHVYVNEDDTACMTESGANFEKTVDELMTAAGVDKLDSVKIEFKSAGNSVLIDSQTIPVLSGAGAYSVVLSNPYTTFEADETGAITQKVIKIKARVFYGLQELQYLSDNGWEYGIITAPAGFTASINVSTGEISLTALAGSSMAESGNIAIPIFIHSQTNTGINIGFMSGTTGIVIGFGSTTVGFLEPDENGYYYTYFNWQKLTQNAIKLAQLNTKVEGYWATITDDLKITEPEKNTLLRLIESITAEYGYYSQHYNHHTQFAAYSEAYEDLKDAVDSVTGYDGTFTFATRADKEEFNGFFETYYSSKSALDNEAQSISTNNGGLSSVAAVNALTPKPTDYFAWVGTDNTSLGTITLRKGLVYCWNGTEWVVDNDNGHIMNTLEDVMDAIKNSSDENIPAVSLFKQVAALKIVTETLNAKFATISQLNAGSIQIGGYATEQSVINLSGDLSDLSDVVDNKADGQTVTDLTQTVLDLSGVVDGKADESDLTELSGTVDGLSATVEEKADKTTVDSIYKSQITYYKTASSKPSFDSTHTSGWSTTKYTGTATNTKYWFAVLYTKTDDSVVYGDVSEDVEYLTALKTNSSLSTKADKTDLNKKRNVFNDTPTVPYLAGDLWIRTQNVTVIKPDKTTETVSGRVIYYAKVSKTSSQSYNEADWEIGDNLQDSVLKEALTQGDTQIIGGYINTNLIEAESIKAEKIDVDDLFAKNIEATDMHLSGNSSVEGKITSSKALFKDDFGCPVFEPYTTETDGFIVDINLETETTSAILTKLNKMFNKSHTYGRTFLDGEDLSLYIVNVEVTPNDNKHVYSLNNIMAHGFCKRKVWNRLSEGYELFYSLVFKVPDGYYYRNIFNITQNVVVLPTSAENFSTDLHFSGELRCMTVFSNINANTIYSSEGYEYSPMTPEVSVGFGGTWTEKLYCDLFRRLNITYPRVVLFEVIDDNNTFYGFMSGFISKIQQYDNKYRISFGYSNDVGIPLSKTLDDTKLKPITLIANIRLHTPYV